LTLCRFDRSRRHIGAFSFLKGPTSFITVATQQAARAAAAAAAVAVLRLEWRRLRDAFGFLKR